MSDFDLNRQISDMNKGKISLSEALKELELSKEAFNSIKMLSRQISTLDSSINDLKFRIENSVPYNYFNLKIEEITHTLDKSVKARIEELSASVLSKLNNKITLEDAESLFNKKVSWSNFNSLSQEVGMIKTRMEKHILSEFEGFKTKLKIELSNVLKQKKPQEVLPNDEILQMKNKISTIEQQIQQIFNEEIDEDYDSQEELDNMMDDLERAVVRNRKSQETEQIHIVPVEIEEKNPEKTEKNEKIEEIEVKIPTIKLEDSPKNMPSSRESRSIIRKNSKSSSAASKIVGGAAAVRNLNKKLENVSKEIEDNKKEFLAFANDSKKFDQYFADLQESINILEQKNRDFADQIEVMQASFLRALRRSGVTKEKPVTEKKSPKPKPKSNLNLKETLGEKEIDEKLKKIVKIETGFSQISADFNKIKVFVKENLAEISESHLKFVDLVVGLKKDFECIKKKEEIIEKQIRSQFFEVRTEINEVKGPLSDIVSDQNRANSSLVEEIKRNQDLVRGLIEDYGVRPNSQLSGLKSAEGRERHHSRVNSATPTLTTKHKYYRGNRAGEVNVEENWLSFMPDGKGIWLPRVSYSSHKSDRKLVTPEIEAKRNSIKLL